MRVKNNQRAGNKKRTACSHASANKNTVAQLQENFFPPPRFNQTTKRSSFWCFGIKARTPAQPAGRESLKTPVQHLVLISESFLIWDKVRKKRKYGKRDRKRDIVHDKQYALWLSFSLLSIKLKIITSRQMDQECVYEQTDTHLPIFIRLSFIHLSSITSLALDAPRWLRPEPFSRRISFMNHSGGILKLPRTPGWTGGTGTVGR